MELSIRQLSKRYANGVQALRNVTLTIPTGLFGLLGPNGAGKSTLMRTLATLQEADSGSVHLGELDVLRNKAEVRKILGYLPQEFGLYPKVTAYDLLDHLASLKGLAPARQRREVVDALLLKVNLHDVRHQRLGSYSGGMKQRFGIAQALLGDPRLIIVDEPTAGLDPEERVRFHNLLGEIGEQIVVILSTHIVDDVSELCKLMAIIHKGEVVAQGDPNQLAESLRGQVWQKTIGKEELPQVQSQHRVLSSHLRTGRTVVHVLADAAPDDTFEATDPELKDVYFAAIRGYLNLAETSGQGSTP